MNTIQKLLVGAMAVAILFGLVAVAHGWLAASFGAAVATVTVFAAFGVALAVVLWVASARFTMQIYRSALQHAEYTNDTTSRTMRSLAPTYRVNERQHLVDAQSQLVALRIAAREARQLPATAATSDDDDAIEAPTFPRRRRVEFL
jgi:hypothetical protein